MGQERYPSIHSTQLSSKDRLPASGLQTLTKPIALGTESSLPPAWTSSLTVTAATETFTLSEAWTSETAHRLRAKCLLGLMF